MGESEVELSLELSYRFQISHLWSILYSGAFRMRDMRYLVSKAAIRRLSRYEITNLLTDVTSTAEN